MIRITVESYYGITVSEIEDGPLEAELPYGGVWDEREFQPFTTIYRKRSCFSLAARPILAQTPHGGRILIEAI